MKLSKNENGVSEIVGAMLILLILVIYLGVLQGYEVPKWNKELEQQEFDLVYNDFLNFRMNLEETSIEKVPRTISMHTGVRYPERFMLRNPGQGAYGTFTTYPLNISISYSSNGTTYYANYTSLGLIYEMKGVSDFPKLVYEHGIVIKEYGNVNYSDDVNHITTDNGIYVPLLIGIEPVSSTEVKTFNILPFTQYNITGAISSMDVTLETRYPGIWANMPSQSRPPGSQFNVNNNNREIKITNIPGFNIRNLSLPVTSGLSQNNIYSASIRFEDANTIINTISNNMTNNITNTITNSVTNVITNNITNTTITNLTSITNVTNNYSVFIDTGNCSSPGRYIWDISQGCVNLPTSAGIQEFIIQDMKFGGSTSNRDIIFNVQDVKGRQFEIQIIFNSNANGDPVSATIQQTKPILGGCTPPLINGQIDLAPCYRAANITSSNVLKITHFDSSFILYVKFIVD